jgi:hypothetical protein
MQPALAEDTLERNTQDKHNNMMQYGRKFVFERNHSLGIEGKCVHFS